MDYKNLKIHLVREATFDEDQPANLTLNVNEFTDNLNSFPIKLFSNDTDKNVEDKSLKTIDQPNKSNNNIVTPTSSEIDTEEENREVNNEINNNTTVSSNSNEMTNTKNFSVDNQNNNSNFEQDYNNVITNLNSFKITPDNNFHLSNNKEDNIKSIIGNRRHSFDQELLNKGSNINQYIFNPSTKRKIEDDIINNRNKIQNTAQYYSNKSNKRSADEEDDTTKTNKRYRKNEVINNLPVKGPGGNIENPSKKVKIRQILMVKLRTLI